MDRQTNQVKSPTLGAFVCTFTSCSDPERQKKKTRWRSPVMQICKIDHLLVAMQNSIHLCVCVYIDYTYENYCVNFLRRRSCTKVILAKRPLLPSSPNSKEIVLFIPYLSPPNFFSSDISILPLFCFDHLTKEKLALPPAAVAVFLSLHLLPPHFLARYDIWDCCISHCRNFSVEELCPSVLYQLCDNLEFFFLVTRFLLPATLLT